MAQPQVAATTVVAGFGTSAVAYGYAMSGTAITSCAAVSVVTSTLFKSNIFTGGQFQNAGIIWSAQGATGGTATAVSTTTIPVWGRVGPGYYTTKTGITAATWSAAGTGSVGLATTSGQNAYWDFMQT